jgi:hypothetical protein
MKTHILNEKKIRNTIRKYILEQMVNPSNKKTEEPKQRCVAGNIIPLEDMVGPSKEFQNYTSSLTKRDGGINGMVDTLDMLRTLRLHPDIKDGGEHLSYSLMNYLNNFRNKNYFDETNNDCVKAMDKVIELYRENDHGEELVKDIEKVLRHQDPTPRAKEYLKRCLILIKEK